MASSDDTTRLTFGIYPGSAVGDDTGQIVSSPPDDPTRITSALDDLQGRDGRPLLVRAYRIFADADDRNRRSLVESPPDPARHASRGRSLDLVAQYQSRRGDVTGYCSFLERLVAEHGAVISMLQVGEEPNVTGNLSLDGGYPAITEAIIAGVSAVKDEARRLGHHHLQVGFNTTMLFGPAASFVTQLAQAGGQRFTTNLDYVGLDFFPDVFRPVPPDRLDATVEAVLRQHRRDVLNTAGLSAIPLRITEHGWPTGPGRPPERQAQVVRTVVTTIARNARSRVHPLHAPRRRQWKSWPVPPVRPDDRRLHPQARLPRLPGAHRPLLDLSGPGQAISSVRSSWLPSGRGDSYQRR